jgi:hypothetical protein
MFAALLFINCSGKVLQMKFPGRVALAETLLLQAGCRDFDIASNRRRGLRLLPPLRFTMELMRHPDMRLAGRIYTEADLVFCRTTQHRNELLLLDGI